MLTSQRSNGWFRPGLLTLTNPSVTQLKSTGLTMEWPPLIRILPSGQVALQPADTRAGNECDILGKLVGSQRLSGLRLHGRQVSELVPAG